MTIATFDKIQPQCNYYYVLTTMTRQLGSLDQIYKKLRVYKAIEQIKEARATKRIQPPPCLWKKKTSIVQIPMVISATTYNNIHV